jgi:hypothetical protein
VASVLPALGGDVFALERPRLAPTNGGSTTGWHWLAGHSQPYSMIALGGAARRQSPRLQAWRFQVNDRYKRRAAAPDVKRGNIFLGALYVSSQGRDGLLIANTPGPIGVGDLPSLADQISVNAGDAHVEIGGDLIAKPRRRKPRVAAAIPSGES